MDTSWTAERIEQLKAFWGSGISASEIADKIGGCNRNMVIGKARRMGLARLAKTPQRGRTTESSVPKIRRARERSLSTIPRPRLPKAAVANRGPVVEIVDSEIPMEQRLTFAGLSKRLCKYPVGDPRKPGFFFCGGPVQTGSPYCLGHHQRCYRNEREGGPFILKYLAA